MKATFGIAAYNEESNIGRLLDAILHEHIPEIIEIIVVDDGSTDRTSRIVNACARNGRVRLIRNKEREGKASAINKILSTAKGGIIILESADTLPEKGAIKKVLGEFRNPRVGMVGSRPVPINKGDGFAHFFGRFIYCLHHDISLRDPKFGELSAFRNVVKQLPMTAVDDEYLAMEIKGKGYELKYCPDAVLYNRQPASVREIILQRRRIHAGHHELKKYGYVPSTDKIGNIIPALIRNLDAKKMHFIALAVVLEAYVKLLGWHDYHFRKKKHHIWEIAPSTKKTIRTGQRGSGGKSGKKSV